MAARREGARETIPVVEERAVVVKRKRATGGVRVRTAVREQEEVVTEPFTTEEVDVVRVPIDRWVEAPVAVRQDGDTTIIPMHEEVVVVEKRLRLTEEVRITKRRITQNASARVTLRREEALVERLEMAGKGEEAPD